MLLPTRFTTLLWTLNFFKCYSNVRKAVVTDLFEWAAQFKFIAPAGTRIRKDSNCRNAVMTNWTVIPMEDLSSS